VANEWQTRSPNLKRAVGRCSEDSEALRLSESDKLEVERPGPIQVGLTSCHDSDPARGHFRVRWPGPLTGHDSEAPSFTQLMSSRPIDVGPAPDRNNPCIRFVDSDARTGDAPRSRDASAGGPARPRPGRGTAAPTGRHRMQSQAVSPPCRAAPTSAGCRPRRARRQAQGSAVTEHSVIEG
jgi:hypothetical protein